MEGVGEVRNCVLLGGSEGTKLYVMSGPGNGDILGVWNPVVFSDVKQKTLFSLSRCNFC